MEEIETPALKSNSSETHSSPELHNYHDYRDYISDRIEYLRKNNSRLSLGSFARRMKVSTAFVSLLIAKKKHLSLETVASFSAAMSLSESDKMLLTFLLLEERASSQEQRLFFHYLASQVRSLKLWENRKIAPLGTPEIKKLFGTEVAMIIYCLAQTKNFQPNADWVRSQLVGYEDYPLDKIESALTEVLAVRQTHASDQTLTLKAFPIEVDGKSLLDTGLKMMQRAIDNLHESPGSFVATCLPFSPEKALEARQAFIEFCNKVDALSSESTEYSEVHFLNAGLFCVAKDLVEH
jgi:DNA-binding transcriptional regulator YiaG